MSQRTRQEINPGFLTHSPDQIERVLDTAAATGADVEDLKAQFPELKRKAMTDKKK